MSGFVCRQCGKSGGRMSTALYCFACIDERRKVRIAPPDRRRQVIARPLQLQGGGWGCVDCETPVNQNEYAGKKRRPPVRCACCAQEHELVLDVLSGRQLAASAIAKARSEGRLSAPTDHKCVDCSRPAEAYDHRDYNEPLNVEPVCRSCNVIRGHAKPFNPYLVGLLLRSLFFASTAEAEVPHVY